MSFRLDPRHCRCCRSDDEREQIGLAKALGHSIGAIAQAIGRPKSTISRELCRNKLPSGRYSPLHAAGAYQLRRRREALIERDRALRTFVVDRLAEGWTPEQISGWLKGGNERRLRAVSCETIYAFIYRAAQRAEQLWRYLTRRHKRRRPRRSRPSQDDDRRAWPAGSSARLAPIRHRSDRSDSAGRGAQLRGGVQVSTSRHPSVDESGASQGITNNSSNSTTFRIGSSLGAAMQVVDDPRWPCRASALGRARVRALQSAPV